MNHEMKRYCLLECSAERAWEALTRPAELQRWLADEARIELAVGGKLQLKTPIPLLSGEHTITTVIPGKVLSLRFMLVGSETALTIRLEEQAGLCRVVLTHLVPDDPALLDRLRDTMKTDLVSRETAWAHVLDSAWMYALLELRSYVEHGEAYCRLRAGEDPLRVDWKIDIDAPADKVFQALVDETEVKGWNTYVGEEVKIERRKGGRYSFGWKSEKTQKDGPDEIVEYQDGHRVSYSWFGDTKTMVSWTVEPLPGEGKTRLHLVHSGFLDNPDVVLDYKLGWAHFAFALADWVTHRRLIGSRIGKEEAAAAA